MNNNERQEIIITIVRENATSEHPITTSEIANLFLKQHNKTIDYRTIKKIINDYNNSQDHHEIIINNNTNPLTFYFNEEDNLTITEGRMIVDMVTSSRFLSKNTKHRFIENIKTFYNKELKDKLDKKINYHFEGNENTMAFYETYYQLIDAINHNNIISFIYDKPQINRSIEDHRYALFALDTYYDNNTLYLYAYDQKDEIIKSFRIDYIKEVKVTGHYQYSSLLKESLEEKIKNSVYSYSTNTLAIVKYKFHKDNYSSMIDILGKNLMNLKKLDQDYYSAEYLSPISNTFYSKLASYGGLIKIIGPEDQVKRYYEFLDGCK